ncbi:MAG: anhydro-N-acetylmuramic acid kinase [Candidatus Riflebacteria bacterium]|nr:anhydro-N-acetylmuramic acid kinase [Candidatus Riflebacteria bacterium]
MTAILGMMSGTSGDGIDGALVNFYEDNKFELLWHDNFDFSREVREHIRKLMKSASSEDCAQAGSFMAELYYNAVASFRESHREKIDYLAVHGQTIWHAPECVTIAGKSVCGTFQAMNSSWLAEKAGISVISDFRSRDLAVGGQGAPLVPFADLRFFGGIPGDTIALNIGGIANLTEIRHTKNSDASATGTNLPFVKNAFDTGPGNMLMDALIQKITNGMESYDNNGIIASKGKTDKKLLEELLSDDYFARKPPKSTGREKFGIAFLEDILKNKFSGSNYPDLMSTLLDLTVFSIADALEKHVFPSGEISQIILAGGGAYNSELILRLTEKVKKHCKICLSDDFGIPVSAREAMAFAALGEAFLKKIKSNIPAATGAHKQVVLGVFTP